MFRLLFELNRGVPNGTLRGVRGRRKSSLLDHLQFDFIRGLEYTIVNECSCKVIYEVIMMEYLSIKQTLEKGGIIVRRI